MEQTGASGGPRSDEREAPRPAAPKEMRTGEVISLFVTDAPNPHNRQQPPLQVGDIVTFDGSFKRRTFWQWLTRKPRELQRFVITSEATSVGDCAGFTFLPVDGKGIWR